MPQYIWSGNVRETPELETAAPDTARNNDKTQKTRIQERDAFHFPDTRKALKIQTDMQAPAVENAQQGTEPLGLNEVINALEHLIEIPADVASHFENTSKFTAPETLSFTNLVRVYLQNNHSLKYSIGEALAEMVNTGKLNPVDMEVESGMICPTRLKAERQKDQVLNALMGHLLNTSGEVHASNSPLPRTIKESHSVEFLNLCASSSKRAIKTMVATETVIQKLMEGNNRPFAGLSVYQAQHAFETDEVQAHGLFSLGLKPENMWFFPKTGARALVLTRLRNMGVKVYDNPYDLRALVNSPASHIMEFLNETFGLGNEPLDQQIEKLELILSEQQKNSTKPRALLIDEGFKIGKTLLDLQLSDNSLVNRKYALLAQLCPMVAHTQGDIIKGNHEIKRAEEQAVLRKIPKPVLPRTINMAQSPAKQLEGNFIAHDAWLSTKELLNEIAPKEVLAQRPKEALIMGYGIISGRAEAQLQAGYDVWLWDINPRMLLKAYLDHDHKPQIEKEQIHIPVDRATLQRVVDRGGDNKDPEFVKALEASKQKWFSHGHITIGNTGAPNGCLSGDEFQLLPNGAILSSAGSGNYEFGKPLARHKNLSLKKIAAKNGHVDFPILGARSNKMMSVRTASPDEDYFHPQVYETRSGTAQAKRFMILRGGSVVNRLYGMPPEFCGITKGMMIQCAAEAIQQPHNDIRPDKGLFLVDPDAKAQQMIIEAVDKDLASKNMGTTTNPAYPDQDIQWHRATLPQETTLFNPYQGKGHTVERFVKSGKNACETYNISPGSFSLITSASEKNFLLSSDLKVLEQIMFPNHKIGKLADSELARPQRTIAHTLFGIFGLDHEVDIARKKIGIDDQQWTALLAHKDKDGMLPSDYAESGDLKPWLDANNQQQTAHFGTRQTARRTLQQCISNITINTPTQSQLKGDSKRKAHIIKTLKAQETQLEGQSI